MLEAVIHSVSWRSCRMDELVLTPRAFVSNLPVRVVLIHRQFLCRNCLSLRLDRTPESLKRIAVHAWYLSVVCLLYQSSAVERRWYRILDDVVFWLDLHLNPSYFL